MQKSSTGYLLGFVVALTVVCAIALAGVFEALKDKTEENAKLEKKTQILGAVMDVSSMNAAQVESIYEARIVGLVLDRNGNVIEGVEPSDIDVKKEYKSGSPQKLPIYKLISEVNPKEFESFILPMYGNGLWDNIWGFVSVAGDYNTLTGAIFDHKAETPGLGAKITEPYVQARFVGKKIFKDNGSFKGVKMQKGEGKNYDNEPHKVDGMSGASMTGAGLNDMLNSYFTYYTPYFEIEKKANGSSSTSKVKAKIDRNHK